MVSCVSHDLFFSEAVLEIAQKVMLVELLYQVRCHNVFKNLAEYTGEVDRSVICWG